MLNDQTRAALQRKVLHVEDDPSVARAVARLLRIQGYDVSSAASGAEAIQVVEDGLVPDVILADYHLPFEMTGDQVVTEITTRLGFRPPTIVLASVPSPEVEKVLSVADCVFGKPADMLLVVREMQHLLSARNINIETSDFPPRARVGNFKVSASTAELVRNRRLE
jgi:two-component system, sensor histidine kinase